MNTPYDENIFISRHTLSLHAPNPIIHLFFRAEDALHQPKTSLSTNLNFLAYSISSQDQVPEPLPLAPGPVNNNGYGFWEIDPYWMPGLYGLQVPHQLRQSGYTYIYLCFPGAHPLYVEIQGVNYDPYDSFALGLETWIRSSCHENLSSGLRNSMPSVLRPLLAKWLATPKLEI